MTDDNRLYDLSRRKVLGGLATMGAAGAGAGLGTSAYFSDEESFDGNELVAGELDLFVDYETSVDQGSATGETGSTTGSGTIDGDPASMQYVIDDVKPGDSGSLKFCPKVVDNPAWVFVGSTGVVDYENGLTEPEADVDGSGGSPGAGAGELSEAIQATVSYCTESGETIRTLNNPDDYTLADLAVDLKLGFPLDGDPETGGTQAYPASADAETQTGPCICVDWELPTEVGNEVQTDSVEFDVTFAAMQRRHNPDPENPFVDAVLTSDATGGIRETDNWITARVSAGPTTVIRIDLDGEVYGGGDSGLGEWPNNPDVYFVEANIDVDDDGIDEAANDDDFRVGFAAADSGARANAISNSTAGASGNGGYIRRNTGGSASGDSPSRTDVAAEDVPGFSAFESADQLSYTLVLDWSLIAGDGSTPTAQLSSAPASIQINEVFGGDGGEGVAATPNSSGDGRGDVDNVADGSSELTL